MKKPTRGVTRRADEDLNMCVSKLKKVVAFNNQKAGQRALQEISRVAASRVGIRLSMQYEIRKLFIAFAKSKMALVFIH